MRDDEDEEENGHDEGLP